MSEDDSRRGGLTRAQLRALLLVGLLIGSAIVAVGAINLDEGYSADGVTYGLDDGPEATITGNTTVENGGFSAGSDTLELNTTDGNFTVRSSGQSHIDVEPRDITGDRTRISGLDVDNETTINPEDKRQIGVQSAEDNLALEWETPALDDGEADARIEHSGSGTADLTFYGLAENTDVAAISGDGYLYDATTTSSSGDATLEIDLRSEESAEDVQLVTSDGSPQVFNPDPSDGEVLSDGSSVDLSFDVDDPNFDEGGQVDVTVDLNGEQIHSETLSSAGTVSTTTTNAETGTNTWTATATNDYGETVSKQWEFGTPENLSVYNESSPDQLIDDREVTLKIFPDSENVYTRNTTDGNVSLAGLPTDEELVISANADQYIQRSVIIKDISQQQRIYLLNESVETNQVRFTLNDQTGTFDEETSTLFIRKAVTVNGDTKFRTVAADQFGVEGYTETLESGDRYRLVVENDQGDTRMLGTYRTTVDETVELRIGNLEYDFGEPDSSYEWNASFEDIDPDEDNEENVIKFNYRDQSDSTSEISVRIYQQGNQSNEIMNTTYSGEYGTFGLTEAVPDGQEGKNWVVDWSATRNGETISGKRVVGQNQQGPGVPLEKTWRIIVAGGVILIVAGLFSQVNAVMGAATVSILGGMFWILNWLPSEVGGGVIVASLVLTGLVGAGRIRGGI